MVMRGGWLGLAALLVTLAGCALEDVRLKPPTSGLKMPIPGGNQRQVIVAVPFADARQITNRCGMQKGGYGNETANALCQGPELGFRHGYPSVVAWRPEQGR
jgi:hypothetical protein